MNTIESTRTTTGSTFSPGDSSVYSPTKKNTSASSSPYSGIVLGYNSALFGRGGNILSIVLVLPPAPAALVLLGRALASLSFWSAAALLRMAVFGPPGGVGDEGLPVL